MPKKEADTLHLELPSNSLSANNTGLVGVQAASLTRGSRQLSKDEQYIGQKLRTDLTVQRGYAIKGEHAEHLAQIMTQRTANRFAEYVEFDREIMSRPWTDANDQADVNAFYTALRQSHANTLFGTRNGAVNRIEEAAVASLEPPEDKVEDVVIEEKPGLFGAFFRGSKVTTVKR